MEKYVEVLAEKAASSNDSNDAMKFAQAAFNLANAACALKTATAN